MSGLRADQKTLLRAPLSRDNVKGRKQGGRNVSYIEAWHAIAEANRIFDFDGWSRETVHFECIDQRERQIGVTDNFVGYPGWGVTYIAKVRIVIHSDNVRPVVREGCGAGHGIDRDLGQAHESALKEAESDAMKRALSTLGNQFGLALYDKEQANVSDEPPPPPPPTAEEIAKREEFIKGFDSSLEQFEDPDRIVIWWNSKEQYAQREKYKLSPAEIEILKAKTIERRTLLMRKKEAGG